MSAESIGFYQPVPLPTQQVRSHLQVVSDSVSSSSRSLERIQQVVEDRPPEAPLGITDDPENGRTIINLGILVVSQPHIQGPNNESQAWVTCPFPECGDIKTHIGLGDLAIVGAFMKYQGHNVTHEIAQSWVRKVSPKATGEN